MGLNISKVSWQLCYNPSEYQRKLFDKSNIDIFQSKKSRYENLKFDDLYDYDSEVTNRLLEEKKAICALAYYEPENTMIAGTIFYMDGHKFYILRLFITQYVGFEFKELFGSFLEKLDTQYPGLRDIIVRINNKYHNESMGTALNNLEFTRITSDSDINKLKFPNNNIISTDCSEEKSDKAISADYTYYINENFDQYI